jgi:CoA:oxalate CoA-transferase
MAKALDDVLILDLTQVLAGPFAVTILADFGANVIQIEPIEGDYSRRLMASRPAETQRLHDWNKRRNRKNMTLNLRSRTGKELFLELVKKADVVVQNFRPGAMDRMGLGYEVLKKSNPGIVYCAISGFGQTGPYKDRLAYDPIIQAASGIMSMTGFPENPPVRVGANLADYVGAVYAVMGILIALHYKQRTGKGQMIDCAMLDAMSHWIVNDVGGVLATGMERIGNKHPWALQELYKTRDDKYIIFAVQTDAQWESFLKMIGREDILAEKWDYHTRLQRCNEMYPIAAAWTQSKTLEEAIAELSRANIAHSAVTRAVDLEHDPQLREREMFNTVADPVVGAVRGVIGIAPKLSETPGSIGNKNGFPAYNQHTEELLRGLLGYDTSDIERLKKEGVIAP